MASQEVVFLSGVDTDERTPSAVAPLSDGELVKVAITNRPTECLRNRSEVIRDELIDQKYLQDTDISWVIAEGADNTGANPGTDLPLLVWDPATGKFVVNPVSNLVLQPLKTPDTDTTDAVVYTFVTDTLTITSLFRNYAGGNRRQVKWVWSSAITGTALAALSGTPNHILTITVADDGSSQTADVDNALAALGAALGAAGFSRVLAGGTDYIVAPPADYDFTKIFEREMHRIPASQFAAFFAVPTNALVDGDTLAVYYEYMIEPGATGGRRQSCPTNLNISIGWGQLFIVSHEPEKLPFCVPICKRIGDDLIFLDGTICYGHMTPAVSPIFMGEHGYTVNRIINAASTVLVNLVNVWADAVAPTGATGTINAALDGIVGDLAGHSAGADGAGKIGAETLAGTPDSISTTTLGNQLVDLLALVNARIKTIHPTASSGTVWVLLWRSNNIASDASVTKSTTSLYWRNGEFSLVVGAYWLPDGVTLTVGSGGTTDVVASCWSGVTGIVTTCSKNNPAPTSPITAADPTQWDSYDCVGNTTATNAFGGIQKRFNCDILYGQDYVALRSDFSTVIGKWFLVYRNGGRTSVNADVDWDTFSVYESTNTAGGVAARMEIYGGYLTDDGMIVSPTGGTGRISFTRIENDTREVLGKGHRSVVVGTPTTLDPVLYSDWDYHEWFGATVPATTYEKIVWGTDGGAGIPDVFQRWNIRQIVGRYIQLDHPAFSYIYGSATADFTGSPGRLFQSYDGLLHIYYDSVTDHSFWFVNNATWSGGQWHEAPAHTAAAALQITKDKIYQCVRHTSGSATWLTWDADQTFNAKGNTQCIFYDISVTHVGPGVVVLPVPDNVCGMMLISVDSKPGDTDGYHFSAIYRLSPGDVTTLVSGNEGDPTRWGVATGGATEYNVYRTAGSYVFENNNGVRAVSVKVSTYLLTDFVL